MLLDREFHDYTAYFLHACTIGVISATNDVFEENLVPATALTVMQGGAFLFHTFYIVLYMFYNFKMFQNQHKWVEYAVTATAGTVAALTVTDTHSTTTVVFVSIAAFLQQSAGWYLDQMLEELEVASNDVTTVTPKTQLLQGSATNVRFPWVGVNTWSAKNPWRTVFAFAAAFLAQIVEFYYVGTAGGPPMLVVVYVLGWGLFGVHSLLRQITLWSMHGSTLLPSWLSRRYIDPLWTETIYSCLGWTSKIMVFGVEWAYLRGLEDVEINGIAGGLLAVSFIVLFATMYRESNITSEINI